jgi:hypothetical protein
LEEVWEQGNLDGLEEIIAETHVHHLTRRDAYGPEGVKQLVLRFRTFLSAVQITIHDLLVDGDKVVAYFVYAATLTQDSVLPISQTVDNSGAIAILDLDLSRG